MGYPLRFTAAVTHEGPWYVAHCLEVDIASQGESLERALDNLREALELYFEDMPLTELPVTPMLAPVTAELPHPNHESTSADSLGTRGGDGFETGRICPCQPTG